MSALGGEPVVELRHVDKGFAGPTGIWRVLTGLDLRVAAGEIVAVAGRSGSGKTTVLTLVAGLEQPDAGRVCVIDETVLPDARPWTDVAIVPQSLGLLGELTVVENIMLPLRLHAGDPATDAGDLMERLGIDHLARRYTNEVSLGEQQRTALARAAIVRPRVLLADEPIAHQNQAWAREMMHLVEHLASSGTTCLLATHNDIAFGSAHRVLELRDGRLHPHSSARL